MAFKSLTGFDSSSQRVINVADPSSASDAATKAYVDNSLLGLRWKSPVRVATTTNITLSGTQTIDTVGVTAGQRVLVKNQSTASENGIYVVAAGTWSRATDADSAAELNSATVFVAEGTANVDKAFTQTAEVTTLGSDTVTWVQFGAGTAYIAGSGLTESPAGTFNIGAGNGITVNADDVALASSTAGAGLTYTSGVLDVVGDASITVGANSLGLASGVAGNGLTLTTGVLDVVAGTGISVAANSVSIDTSVVSRKFATQSFGNGSLTTIDVTHNLNTKDITWSLRQVSNDTFVVCDAISLDVNTIRLTFAVAPLNAEYRLVVQG